MKTNQKTILGLGSGLWGAIALEGKNDARNQKQTGGVNKVLCVVGKKGRVTNRIKSWSKR